jgi:hypothetical protein
LGNFGAAPQGPLFFLGIIKIAVLVPIYKSIGQKHCDQRIFPVSIHFEAIGGTEGNESLFR